MVRRALMMGLLLLGVSCHDVSGDSGRPVDGGLADGGNVTGGGSATGGGTSSMGGGTTGGGTASMDACVPLTCATAPVTCGLVSDGCGHTLNCGACNCTATTFQTDCPARPCEVVTGCAHNACEYEPISCSFERCTSCLTVAATDGGADGGSDGGAGSGTCSDTSFRACGAGCAANFCDPTPSVLNGKVVYGNRCVARTQTSCGLCGLGGYTCEADGGTPSCADLTLAGVNPTFVECNGSSPAATVLYVDPTDTGSMHTGSKEAPFLTLEAALTAAGMRGSRAIIIGGTPTFTGGLLVANGVSVLGGYSGVPSWLRDPTRRPTITVTPAALANGRLVAVTAAGITTPTMLSNLDIVTPSLVATPLREGASTVGLLSSNAPALVLSDVRLTVGDAQPGAGQADAKAPVATPLNPPATGKPAGAANGTCFQTQVAPSQGGIGQTFTCDGQVDPRGRGGDGATTVRVPNSSVGVVWVTGGTSAAGSAGGLATFTNRWEPGHGTDGQPFTARATDGTTPSANYVWTSGFPVTQGRGGDGAPGSPGRGGGGGGSGAASESLSPTVCRVGGGGGAGGAGGCGGLGGAGGFQGGWAFGLVITGAPPTLQSTSAVVGAGGLGGTGGKGSSGLTGQAGGAGGTQAMNLPAYTGSNGGKGSDGQAGGLGADGASGLSRGVVCDSVHVDLSHFTAASRSSASTFTVAEGCN